jgi:hypothetical protein
MEPPSSTSTRAAPSAGADAAGAAPGAENTLEFYEEAIRAERAEAARLSSVLAAKTAEYEALRAETEEFEALLAQSTAAANAAAARGGVLAVDGAGDVALDADAPRPPPRGAAAGEGPSNTDTTDDLASSEINAVEYLALIEAEAERLAALHDALTAAVREAESAAAAATARVRDEELEEGGVDGDSSADADGGEGGGAAAAGAAAASAVVRRGDAEGGGVDMDAISEALDVVPFLLTEVKTLSAQLSALEAAADDAGDGDGQEAKMAKLAALEARVALLTRLERLSQFEAVLASLDGDDGEDAEAARDANVGVGGGGHRNLAACCHCVTHRKLRKRHSSNCEN